MNHLLSQSSVIRLLSRLSLKYQIGSLGALGIVGLLIFGAISFVGQHHLSSWQQRAKQADEAHDATAQLKILLLEARRAEMEFILRRDQKLIKQHRDVIARASVAAEILSGLLASTRASAELQHKVEALKPGITAYGSSFGKLAEAQGAAGLSQDAIKSLSEAYAGLDPENG